MNENDFSNYDLRKWLDRGLSRHPEPMPAGTQNKKAEGRLPFTRLFLPLAVAGSMLAVGGPTSSQTNGRVVTAPIVQADSSRYAGASTKVSWTVAVPERPGAASSDFSAKAAALIQRIRTNNFADIPTETLRLAAAIPVYRPTVGAVQDPWISELANSLAKFTD
jgi:hypothetical protein